MDGYLYHDQIARMFHLLLEICKYDHYILNVIHIGTWWFRISSSKNFFRNALVLFHDGAMFYFWVVLHHSKAWVFVVLLPCLGYVFLFQLSTILFIPRQRAITGATYLVNWLASSTVFCRSTSRDLRCLSWSSGMNMCWQTTHNSLLFLIKSF